MPQSVVLFQGGTVFCTVSAHDPPPGRGAETIAELELAPPLHAPTEAQVPAIAALQALMHWLSVNVCTDGSRQPPSTEPQAHVHVGSEKRGSLKPLIT
jgi:hypothetical protein